MLARSQLAVRQQAARQFGKRSFSMPGLPFGPGGPQPHPPQPKSGGSKLGTTLKILGGFLFFNALATAGRVNEEKKVLRQSLFQAQVELERVLKQFDDESFYEDLSAELRYNQNRPSEIVKDMLNERVAKPVKAVAEKADKALVTTDRSPKDREMREKKKLEFFERKATEGTIGNSDEPPSTGMDIVPAETSSSDAFPMDGFPSNNSGISKEKW